MTRFPSRQLNQKLKKGIPYPEVERMPSWAKWLIALFLLCCLAVIAVLA